MKSFSTKLICLLNAELPLYLLLTLVVFVECIYFFALFFFTLPIAELKIQHGEAKTIAVAAVPSLKTVEGE